MQGEVVETSARLGGRLGCCTLDIECPMSLWERLGSQHCAMGNGGT